MHDHIIGWIIHFQAGYVSYYFCYPTNSYHKSLAMADINFVDSLYSQEVMQEWQNVSTILYVQA